MIYYFDKLNKSIYQFKIFTLFIRSIIYDIIIYLLLLLFLLLFINFFYQYITNNNINK